MEENKTEKYIVVDVETPNSSCSSICQIGCVLIDGDSITGEWSTLVNPEDVFDDFCIGIHGIRPSDVCDAPSFPEVWEKLEELSTGRIFIAHNAQFDTGVITKCLLRYGISFPGFDYTCTLRIARSLCRDIPHEKGAFRLNALAEALGVKLDRHHDALCDSLCCAGIFLTLKKRYTFDTERFLYHSKET